MDYYFYFWFALFVVGFIIKDICDISMHQAFTQQLEYEEAKIGRHLIMG
jgi:hypothetical protein